VTLRRLALVVPCFNEGGRLDARAFRSFAIGAQHVDDGSTDTTRALLESLRRDRPDNVSVVAYDENQGKAEAVRRGVSYALSRSPDAVGFWDADLATPLSELPRFVDVLDRRSEIDIVIGSRVQLMGRAIERRAYRHYFGRLFATAASLTLDLPVYDTQCGAKLFRSTPLLARVFREPFLARWIFDVEILARFLAFDPRGAGAVAQSIYELPLRRWSDIGGSKVKSVDFARAAVDLATIFGRYSNRFRRRDAETDR
jgi:dolichyl-phosphate beta-glucosyltransferase